jgi:hypothetical protein
MEQIDWLSRLLDIIPVSGTKSESSERRASEYELKSAVGPSTDIRDERQDEVDRFGKKCIDLAQGHFFSIRGAAEVESKWLAADCSRRAILPFYSPPTKVGC